MTFDDLLDSVIAKIAPFKNESDIFGGRRIDFIAIARANLVCEISAA
jgi:hypothetical protein